MTNEVTILTPAALVKYFQQCLDKRFHAEAVCYPKACTCRQGANYGGMYYDSLKDEYGDAFITLVVPALLRPSKKLNSH